MGNNLKAIILLLLVTAAGCASTMRYMPYTDQKFTPKNKYFMVQVYNVGQTPPVRQYYVIGKVELSGHAGDGVTPQSLVNRAIRLARNKGADAIVNAQSQAFERKGVDVIPGQVSYESVRFHRHHRVLVEHVTPPAYLPYTDTIFTFQGDLVSFSPAPVPPKSQ